MLHDKNAKILNIAFYSSEFLTNRSFLSCGILLMTFLPSGILSMAFLPMEILPTMTI